MTYVDEKIARLIQDLITELQNEILTFIVKTDILQASVLTLLISSVFINDLRNTKGCYQCRQQETRRSVCMLKTDQNDKWDQSNGLGVRRGKQQKENRISVRMIRREKPRTCNRLGNK